MIDTDGLGPVTVLAGKGSRPVTLASDRSGRIAALWAREQNRGQLIEAADLRLEKRAVALAAPAVEVSPVTGHPFQGYPAAAWGPGGRLLVAWEDRHAGRTRLFHARRESGKVYAPARQLNKHFAPTGSGREAAGLGSRAMRVSLAVDNADTVRAIWLDKRNPNSGYAV